jgi:dTDP-4-dehydrorhamnose 3,5-epimerase
MKFKKLFLEPAYLIEQDLFKDDRGLFFRYFSLVDFSIIGHKGQWVQMNHSFTFKKGTIRGMHFQISPFEEIKLVRCISGSVYDVIIDMRRSSSNYLKWQGFELNSSNKNALYIPKGFAHGFQVLEDNSELLYMHTAIYNKDYERGVRYDDPAINIIWPLNVTLVSERDKNHPLL